MELEEFILLVRGFDFEHVIKQESREYLTNGCKFVSYHDKGDDKKFITNGLKRFINQNDKIIFLLEAINYLNEKLIDIEKTIDYDMIEPSSSKPSIYDSQSYQANEERKEQKKKRKAQIFYAVRELEKLGLKNLDKSAFTNEQVDDLSRKINVLLIKIDELTVGQEVIYNFINELKEDLNEMKNEFPLGKKRWYQRFSGIMASYLGHKGADAVYEYLKPDLFNIINTYGIEKLLK